MIKATSNGRKKNGSKSSITKKQVLPKFSKELPGIDKLFNNSPNQRKAIDAIWYIYSYSWECLSVTYSNYNQGLIASLSNAGISNINNVFKTSLELLSELNKYIARADAREPKKANCILKKLSDKIADILLSRNIDPWIVRSSLLSEAVYTWRVAGLSGIAENYQVIRGNFDFTRKFRRLQKATHQSLEYFNEPEKEIRELVRALVDCGWALSHREFGHSQISI
ncbi:hypothetical protein CH352_00875 [Leptospira hartskeerlii]|uniref:Uncharacterized protein n=1 Tax=Leptospira hartskeerlii TaxID=2023177 RepID=A0A2M9X8D6_9LEPT|nr:hypothetical protein [Leptospira hartskeerlii]PJZ23957.1 hypothetical protein CH357_18455 [Leptospira hartskeerlii]PJZ35221.1 hypothetical protein CH352_00875 [Leptospira hartskeerlii]